MHVSSPSWLKCFLTLYMLSGCYEYHDQMPANGSIAGLFNSSNISTANHPPKRDAPPSMKETNVLFCTGAVSAPPDETCAGTCTPWHGWLDAHWQDMHQPGTACIQTDCMTSFTACSRKKKGFHRWCTDDAHVDMSQTPGGNCTYDVPGTDHIYLYV